MSDGMFDFLHTYILDDDDRPVPCRDILAWGRWKHEHGHRCRVDLTTLGESQVSTVFLAQDARLGDESLPILYETAVRRPNGEWRIMDRYATREEAQAGHDAVVLHLLTADMRGPDG